MLNNIRLILLLLVVLSLSCVREFTNAPAGNIPPKTYLALNPDSSLRRTSSQQHLHWWGVDPDGFVVGYQFSFDNIRWNFTASNDSLFSLRLNRTDTAYSFFVRAVDNNGAVDPVPATLQIPIQNTPPAISFVVRTDVPETTYTVATFQFSATDVDGNETIMNILYTLDDTSGAAVWKNLPGSSNRATLYKSDGLVEGNHVFYLRAQDIAGAYSKTIRMPDSGKVWYVREPKGDFLIVDDYLPADLAPTFYKQMFDTLLGGRLGTKDIWDIKKGASSVSRAKFVPALINPTFTETLKLFKYVFWYSDNQPSLEIAQSTLPAFKQAGGKVLFTSGFPENVVAQGSLVDFAPIDNVEQSYFTLILSQRDTILTDSDPTYPILVRDTLGSAYGFPRGIIPKLGARILYRMARSPRWTGQPIMGVKDGVQANFVLFGGILHRFGTPPNNVKTFLEKVFKDEFGVQ